MSVKHTIEFSLPEDQDALKSALDGPAMRDMLFEFGEWLRRKYKHTVPKSADAKKEYEEIEEKFREALGDHGIELL